jgi:hypothetical protein
VTVYAELSLDRYDTDVEVVTEGGEVSADGAKLGGVKVA